MILEYDKGPHPSSLLVVEHENPARQTNHIKPPNLRSDRAAELGAGLKSTKNGGSTEYEEEQDPSVIPPNTGTVIFRFYDGVMIFLLDSKM